VTVLVRPEAVTVTADPNGPALVVVRTFHGAMTPAVAPTAHRRRGAGRPAQPLRRRPHPRRHRLGVPCGLTRAPGL